MKPGVYNITAKQGATFRLALNWTDETAATVNMTGARARLVVRYKPDSTNALLECDSQGASPRITLGGTPNNIVVLVDKATMLAMKPGNFSYDLEVTDSQGADWPLLTGRFEVPASTVQA